MPRLKPEILSRHMMIGRKKNFAIEASINPRKRSSVRFFVLNNLFSAHVEIILIAIKNVKFAERKNV